MPSLSRESQVDLSVTPFYHCISRCVRRAFLCGEDNFSGQNFDHRKGWFIERLRVATDAFAIDVCAYAVMSNHFHVVLRVDEERAARLSNEAVLRRTAKLFPFVAQSVRALADAAQQKQLAVLRSRLTDISWFMRVINEHVARRANQEDGCTGRFWEGRFKSQALLDEAALYTCMSYVDLNPVRAGMADTLEGSEYTSIAQRLREQALSPGARAHSVRSGRRKGATGAHRGGKPIALAPLRAERRGRSRPALEMRFDDYRELLEWTGRAAGSKPGGTLRDETRDETRDENRERDDESSDSKSKRESGDMPALLTRLSINPAAWLRTMTQQGLATGTSLGTERSMNEAAKRRGKRWLKGKRAAKALFGNALFRNALDSNAA